MRVFAALMLLGFVAGVPSEADADREEPDFKILQEKADSVLVVADTINVEELILAGKTVLVDAGHGGRDAGAIRDGVMEKDINLSVAMKLKDKLEELGASVVMTRDSDTTLSLDERVQKSSIVAPDAFISIHTNANSASSVDGIEAYYYNEGSKDLADSIFESLVDELEEPGNWSRKRDLRVVQHATGPAVLVEIGYLSNESTRSLLLRDDYQLRVAKSIADGLNRFFRQQAEQ